MQDRLKIGGEVTCVAAERLTRTLNGKKLPSTSVRLKFLAQNVKIGFITYPVRPYTMPPLQCYRCQRYGHTANGCNSAVRCMVCSGPHSVRDCTSTILRCANCDGGHKANFTTCLRAPRRAENVSPAAHGVSSGAGEDFSLVPSPGVTN